MYANSLKSLNQLKSKNKHVTTSDLFRELRDYRALLKSMPDGMEGMAAGLPKILIGVVDVFIRIGNTFKTNITKFTHKLKRSEIKYYTESNRLKVAKVEDSPYARFVTDSVHVPTGMTVSYITAIENIETLYTQIGIVDIIKPFVKHLTELENMLRTGDETAERVLTDLTSSIRLRKPLLEKAVTDNKKNFTDLRETSAKVKFEKVYKSMEEFTSTRARLIELEPNLNNTLNIRPTVDDADSSLVTLTQYLSDNAGDNVTKKMIGDVIDIVEYVGMGFDLQGRTSMQQMTLEHNHVLNLNNLYLKL